MAVKLRCCHWQRAHNDDGAAAASGRGMMRLAATRPMRRDDMVVGGGGAWLMKLKMAEVMLLEGVGGFFLGPNGTLSGSGPGVGLPCVLANVSTIVGQGSLRNL